MPRNSKALYVEPKAGGGYKVTRGGAQRPSTTAPNQQKAIDKARNLDPDAAIHVARVRHVPGGEPDKFRKVKGE